MADLMCDASGLPLTCSSQDALDSFNKGLLAYVTLKESPAPWFREALEKDGDFIMAHSLMVF